MEKPFHRNEGNRGTRTMSDMAILQQLSGFEMNGEAKRPRR